MNTINLLKTKLAIHWVAWPLFLGLATAVQAASTDIADAPIGSSAAAVAVANAHVTSTDNAFYASTYDVSNWTGNLEAFSINTTTGMPNPTAAWAARNGLVSVDPLTRKIATSTDALGAPGGRQFTATGLSTNQLILLNTPPSGTDGAAVLAYLRGDRSGETAGTYRVRTNLLGDIVNAEPLLVRAPRWSYTDTGYSAFATANASRTRIVYQAANDGMLHAFNATTGAEEWGYIPNLVLGNLNNPNYLNKLSKLDYLANHKYFVDGTPVAGDVDFQNTATASGGGDWRTILVGGLGKGGRGYYALNVTSPIFTDEAGLASKVLWEFPNSITNSTVRAAAILNMGYSFGKPVIVKTATEGWVVLVTSGYNNGTNVGDSGGDGLGHLYVINPSNGNLIKDIPTTGCTTLPLANPCGLAQISAYTENTDEDNTTDYVYGGDLKGNVWRFNLTGNKNSWGVTKFAVLKDVSGATQPITTAPELSKITISGAEKRFLYIGTGQYLGESDVPGAAGQNDHAIQTQTLYGLIDTPSGTTLPDPLRSSLQAQTLTTSGTNRSITSNSVDFATKKGWYIDMLDAGERISTDPILAAGVLIFTSNIPNAGCIPECSSWLYFVDYKTGGKVTGSTSAWSSEKLGVFLASRPVVIQLPDGSLRTQVRTGLGTTISKAIPRPLLGGFTSKRMTWRQIIR